MAQSFDVYDSTSPFTYRYRDSAVAHFLSENAFTIYKLRVEIALVRALCARGLCDSTVVEEIVHACGQVTTDEVYEEEHRIGHDIRALVNCIQKKVSERARPFVHMTATSYDIIDTANAARHRDAMKEVVIPALLKLMRVLNGLAESEAKTAQVGRTHGQHAVPITFGFDIAQFVSRLGNATEALQRAADGLQGKFSGAVGAYNASALFFDDPQAFEAEVLAELNLTAAEISTQIAPPEAMQRLMNEVEIVAGILGNLARNMRNLQRTEIGEVGEEFEANQVGSSTMPQKRNPIGFENVESMWKIIFGLLAIVHMDQISDHQRDLTNSASGRMYGDIISCFVTMIKRMTKCMAKLRVDHGNLQKNLAMSQGLILAEPLYILLASLGHPDAHEYVRKLTIQAQSERVPLEQIIQQDEQLVPYLERMTSDQRKILSDPLLYRGIAPLKAVTIASRWKDRFQT